MEEERSSWAIWVILPVCVLATILVTRWMIKNNSTGPAALTEEYNAVESNAATDADSEAPQQYARDSAPDIYGKDTRQAGKTAPAPRQAEMTAERQAELSFLRKHDREIKRYQAYLRRLGLKYKAQYPALRQLDSDFAKMDRYMALKKQYDSDRDAYKWARGIFTLPEVRNRILSASGNPEVLKAMIGLSLEALRSPPPAAIHDEVMRFLCTDKQATRYVDDISMGAMDNITSALPYAVTPGMDLTPIKKIGEQITSHGTESR